MTERTNPLLNRRPSGAGNGFVMVGDHQVPTEIHAYCAWLNERERRTGTWRVVERDGHRQVEFLTERGSAEWLADKGFAPKVGRAA
jgi:hypothetical protein